MQQDELSRGHGGQCHSSDKRDYARLSQRVAEIIVGVTTFGADLGGRELLEWMFQLETLL